MKLTLPLPLNLANARLHWAQQHRARRKYYEVCDSHAVVGIIPGPPAETPERAQVALKFFLHNKQDPDNLAHRAKWVLDYLVTRGYLKDDREANMEWVPPEQEIDRKNKRVEIEIIPLGQTALDFEV